MEGFHSAEMTVTGIGNVVFVVGAKLPRLKIFGPRRYHGLVYRISGFSSYFIDGGEALETGPGSVIYLPQGRPYRVYTQEYGNCIAINFYLLQEALREPLLFSPRGEKRWEALFRTILKTWTAEQVGRVAASMAILYQLLAMTEEACAEQYMPARRLEALRRSAEAIETGYADPALSISALAESAGLSLAYFRQQFQLLYGTPPKRYMVAMRIRRAKELLEAREKTVSQIAEAVGYEGIYHFSKSFKAETGMSPTQYRDLYSPEF